MYSIKRWVETDTGHRVPNHNSKCKNFHGHRYRWEAEVTGDLVKEDGVSEEGMIMDFSEISNILKTEIHDLVDHAFILYEGDKIGIDAISLLEDNHRTVIVPFIPTAENLAKWAYEIVKPRIISKYGNKITLKSFIVRETPKSHASWSERNDI